jgi:hypothetical protein
MALGFAELVCEIGFHDRAKLLDDLTHRHIGYPAANQSCGQLHAEEPIYKSYLPFRLNPLDIPSPARQIEDEQA